MAASGYISSTGDTRKVSKSGDTMTGELLLPDSSPDTALAAASKGYVDAQASLIGGVVVSGAPSTGQVPTATSSTTATWQAPGAGTPSGTVTSETAFGQAASAGAASAYARGDHTHGTPAMPRLDQVAAPTGPVSLNSQKITSLANGVGASDAAAFGQIPVAGTGPGTYAAGDDARITGAAQKASNLSDLASASTSRSNLGLGGSAVLNVGTTTGTVAAGDDSRITGAAQKAQNLADLSSASTARTNLGLGGAATLNVGTAASTVAAGDDARVTGAAQKAANLSDLASASAARGNLRVAGPLPVDYGLVSWSYPPAATSSSGAGATGVIYFMLVPVPVATTITGVRLFQVSAGATLTAGQCLAGLYDAAGNRVAVSSDQSGAWASGAVVNKDAAFTGPYSASAGLYWAAMLFNGTSGPVWCKGAPGGMANAGWGGGAPYPAMSSGSGQTSLPASIAYGTLGFSGSAFWASIY